MHGGINAHWNFIWILSGNLFIHVEEITVFFLYHFLSMMAYFFRTGIFKPVFITFHFAVSENSFCIIKIYRLFRRAYTKPGITTLFRSTARYVPRNKIPKSRIFSFQVIVSFVFRNITGFTTVILFFRNPDPPVITQRFGHQG